MTRAGSVPSGSVRRAPESRVFWSVPIPRRGGRVARDGRLQSAAGDARRPGRAARRGKRGRRGDLRGRGAVRDRAPRDRDRRRSVRDRARRLRRGARDRRRRAGPRSAPAEPPAESGPRSVDVPGAVAGWGELSRRFGRLGLERCLRPAIELARDGVPAGWGCAQVWRTTPRAPAEFGAPPAFGGSYRLPELAATLFGIATHGPEFLYTGPAPPMRSRNASWLTLEDLAAYRPRWVEPLVGTYRGFEVYELPPPTQGVAVLEALAILGDSRPELLELVRAVGLALEDALATVRDGADVGQLLSERARGSPPRGARRCRRRAAWRDRVRGRCRSRRDGGIVAPEPVRVVRVGRGRGVERGRAQQSRRGVRGAGHGRWRHAPLPHADPGDADARP